LGDGWISYLISQEDVVIEGRFFSFDANTKKATFKPKDTNQIGLLAVGKTYTYLDGYWGERVALVLDKSRQWKRVLFKPQDAVEYTSGNMRILDKLGQSPSSFVDGESRGISGGWDHEHCVICWEKIAEYAQSFGYTDQNAKWVCENCYTKYVQPKRFDFLSKK